jgi:dTDP-4-dehydrorhamnose 3,5-epimerase
MTRNFEFLPGVIPGLMEINPFVAQDDRGEFIKDYSKDVFAAHGVMHDLSEVFYTVSRKGVVRALHFQRVKQQPKLVRCLTGRIWDVVVDLRVDSPMFRKWVSFDLSGENHRQILIPAGCAHGYLVLEDSVVSYKCSERFYGEYDDGIRWDDPEIAVDWPLSEIGGAVGVILSDKDRNLPRFREFMHATGGFRCG